jgi:hypothetical protein
MRRFYLFPRRDLTPRRVATILLPVKALVLILLLAPAAGARDADAPGAPAQRAREAVALLPAQARAELRAAYLRYRAEVERRLESGWGAGVVDRSVVADPDRTPARQLEQALASRQRELAQLEARLAATDGDAPEYGALLTKVAHKKDDIDAARDKAARAKGTCRDWSDDVWWLLTDMKLKEWTVSDRQCEESARGAGAVVCADASEPEVCLVLDPWTSGEPLVYAEAAWSAGQPGGRLPPAFFLSELPEKAP